MTELGKEYASALFELARENSCEKEFSDALGLIERQFEAQPHYAELLSSPDISIGERRKLLEAALNLRRKKNKNLPKNSKNSAVTALLRSMKRIKTSSEVLLSAWTIF